MTRDDSGSRVRWIVWVIAVGILVLTLSPTGSTDIPGPFECLLCGVRGLADVILNVVLFVPLGLGLSMAAARRPWYVLAALGVLLSLGVELTQAAVPGRHPSFGDFMFNGLGTSFGIVLHRHAGALAFPARRTANTLAIASAAAAGLAMSATGVLLRPRPTDVTYFMQWTPHLAHLEPYSGTVSSTVIGDSPITPGAIQSRALVDSVIRGGRPLLVTGTGGEFTRALAPVISIYDGARREIVLFGVDRADLVVRYRKRAADFHLDQPDLRIYGGAQLLRSDEPFTVKLQRTGDGFCMTVNGRRECPAFTVARGWALLLYDEYFPASVVGALDVLWLMLLAAPAGMWVRARSAVVACAVIVTGVAWLTGTQPGVSQPGPAIYVSLLAGLGAGAALSVLLRRRAGLGLPEAASSPNHDSGL